MKTPENPTFTVRDAVRTDLPAIVDIYNQTIPGRMVTADTERITVESREKWFSEHSANHRPLWVIESEGEMAGWLSFRSFYGRPAYEATCEVGIYISEHFRGKGLGQFFLQRAIDQCPSLGIKTLLGFIFGHNTPSILLFEKFGFSTWGHLPRVASLDGIERDLVIMGKRI